MGVPEDSRTSPTFLGRMREAPDDPVVWREFVRRYGPLIYSWCRRRGLQVADAEDVTQGVLLDLTRCMRIFHYDPSRSFRGYLRTLAHRAWCDFLASPQRRQRGSGDDEVFRLLQEIPADDLGSSLEPAFDAELLEKVYQKVRLLVEPGTWEVFRLRVCEGLRAKEVAALLNRPVATVYAIQSRVQKLVVKEIRRLKESEDGL